MTAIFHITTYIQSGMYSKNGMHIHIQTCEALLNTLRQLICSDLVRQLLYEAVIQPLRGYSAVP